jgi:hypothetical protein
MLTRKRLRELTMVLRQGAGQSALLLVILLLRPGAGQSALPHDMEPHKAPQAPSPLLVVSTRNVLECKPGTARGFTL